MVPGLERGIRLLGTFTRHESSLTAAEITRRLALPHATVYRLLHTLTTLGLLRKTASGYSLGPRILTLGFEFLSSMNLVEVARPELEHLRDELDTSTNMGVLDGREVIYVAHVPSRRPLSYRMQVGSRFPAHASSIGRLLLGDLTDEEFAALYAGAGARELKRDANLDPDELRATVLRDRRRGHVIAGGLFYEGLLAVAAPVFDHRGRAVAGVNISGPLTAFTTADVESIVKDSVRACAKRVSALLGFAP
jgi:DNA-binding IclR family transcriptional regulator